jgi:hypothetical protein
MTTGNESSGGKHGSFFPLIPITVERGFIMLTKYRGGQKVEKGDYWNYCTGERVHVDGEKMLPGENCDKYVKAHPVAVLFAAPILGLAYAAFLPLIGFVMLITVVTKKALGGLAGQITHVAGVRWSPNAAYFSGKKGAHKEKTDDSGEKSE